MARSFKKGQKLNVFNGPYAGKNVTFVMWDKGPTQVIVKVEGIPGQRTVHVDHIKKT